VQCIGISTNRREFVRECLVGIPVYYAIAGY